MQYLIDGYNLLHVTGIFSRSAGPHALPELQASFLSFLASRLGRAQAERTTVVFDAKGRRAIHRRTRHHAGITVHYAARSETADDYMIDLLEHHHAPRNVLVVSSDRAVQRAARRYRAQVRSSREWYLGLLQDYRRRTAPPVEPPAKHEDSLSAREAQEWLALFDPDLLGAIAEDQARTGRASGGGHALPQAAPTKPDSTPPPVAGSATPAPPRAKGGQPPASRRNAGKSRRTPPRSGKECDLTGSAEPFPPEYLATIAEELQLDADTAPPRGSPRNVRGGSRTARRRTS